MTAELTEVVTYDEDDYTARRVLAMVDVTTPAAQLNVQLIERVRELIASHPERHEQGLWIDAHGADDLRDDFGPDCGTSACVAGWAVLLEHELADAEPARVIDLQTELHQGPLHGSWHGSWLHPVNREARRALGLDDHDADVVFHPALTTDETLTNLAALLEHAVTATTEATR